MYEDILAQRLVHFRTLKGVSAREMSSAIEMDDGYIEQIENGKTSPSVQTFFNICEYLSVTPKDFFDVPFECPSRLTELIKGLENVEPAFLEHIVGLVTAYNRRGE